MLDELAVEKYHLALKTGAQTKHSSDCLVYVDTISLSSIYYLTDSPLARGAQYKF